MVVLADPCITLESPNMAAVPTAVHKQPVTLVSVNTSASPTQHTTSQNKRKVTVSSQCGGMIPSGENKDTYSVLIALENKPRSHPASDPLILTRNPAGALNLPIYHHQSCWSATLNEQTTRQNF